MKSNSNSNNNNNNNNNMTRRPSVKVDEGEPRRKRSSSTESTSSLLSDDSSSRSSEQQQRPTLQRSSIFARSFADRARVFDKSFQEKQQSPHQASSSSPQRRPHPGGGGAAALQALLDASFHRKTKHVSNGRKSSFRNDSNPGTSAEIVRASSLIVKGNAGASPLRTLMDASEHRKQRRVSDGVKPAYRSSSLSSPTSSRNNNVFVIPPTTESPPPRPTTMGRDLQKLLDEDSRHRKEPLLPHRLAHRMMLHPPPSSQHETTPNNIFLTFHLRKVKNRVKPDLPEGIEPLKPTEITFPNVVAPKLKIDVTTYQPPVYPKTLQEQAVLKTAMQSTYVLKHQPASTVQALVQAMEPMTLSKHQVLLDETNHSNSKTNKTSNKAQEKEEDRMYIVQHGHLQVQDEQGKIVQRIEAGQTFGQERLLHSSKPTTTTTMTLTSGSDQTKVFGLGQVTFRALQLQHYRQVVLKELQSKVPLKQQEQQEEESFATTPHEDLYYYETEEEEDDDFGSYLEEEEVSHDDDDDRLNESTDEWMSGDSFAADDLSTDGPSLVTASTSSAAHSKTLTTSTSTTSQKRRQRRRCTFCFEDSPDFQLQESLRKSVANHCTRLEDLEKIKVLGEGQFGEVWLVEARLPDQTPVRQQFALKLQELIAEEDLDEDEEALNSKEEIVKEVQALKDLQHPFICNLVHTYESKDSLDMLLGLIPGGELWDGIHREQADGSWKSGIPEGKARFLAYVLADTLGFIHSRGYIFRDLKPENVMLDQDGYPVIVDFGFAKYLKPGERTHTFCGTPNYVAPEIITSVGHGKEVDYWALGVVIYEMVSGENPFFFDGMNQSELYQTITEEDPFEMSEGIQATDQVRELTDLLFLKDPAERLGAQGVQEILDHPWFIGMPPMADILTKKVSPEAASELIFEEIIDDEEESVLDTDDHDTFADCVSIDEETLVDEEEEEASVATTPRHHESPVQVDLSERYSRSSSFQSPTYHEPPLHEDRVTPTVQEQEGEGKEEGASSPALTPKQKNTKETWSPRRKGLGYLVKMLSPQDRKKSQTRRKDVDNFLSQYLADVDLDADDDFLSSVPKPNGVEKPCSTYA